MSEQKGLTPIQILDMKSQVVRDKFRIEILINKLERLDNDFMLLEIANRKLKERVDELERRPERRCCCECETEQYARIPVNYVEEIAWTKLRHLFSAHETQTG